MGGEIDRLQATYRSIGILTDSNWSGQDLASGADLLSSSGYVDFVDGRRYASGVLRDMYNPDVDGWSSDAGGKYSDQQRENNYPMGVNVSDVWLSGQVKSIGYHESLGEEGAYLLRLAVDEVLTGFPEYAAPQDLVMLYCFIQEATEENHPLDGLEEGGRVFVRACYDPLSRMIPMSAPPWASAKQGLILKPLDDADTWYLPLALDEKVDMDAPGHAAWKDEFERISTNQAAVMLISTKDMSAIPDTQQASRRHYLTQGRWLERADDLDARKVCVIHQGFADLRGLSVGDILAMTVRDFGEELYYLGYMTGPDFYMGEGKYADWRNFPTEDMELEIVGIYGTFDITNSNMRTTRSLTVYIPDTVMPEGYGMMGAYSFVLSSFLHQDAFMEEFYYPLAEMGIRLDFVESNAANFWASVAPIRQALLLNLIIFSLTALTGLTLAVFVLIYAGRKEFAILRALGMSKRGAAVAFMLPGLAIGLAGIIAGGVSAWNYALEKAAVTLSAIDYHGEVAPDISLSATWLVFNCAVLVFLLLALLGTGTALMSGRSVVEMLQGAGARRGGGRR